MNFKKILITLIIILLLSTPFLPVILAVDNYTDYELNKSRDSCKIVTSENYQEIITFIKGRVILNWIERRGYFHGEAFLICRYQSGLIYLSGYRRTENGIEYYNESIEKGLIYINRLICNYIDYSNGMIDPKITGIAIGNIDWREYE